MTEKYTEESEYGAYSDDLNMDIDGNQVHVTIYHRYIDLAWTEYTAVLDDGTVISQNKSLRHGNALFGDEE
jgi:hypothetical protein